MDEGAPKRNLTVPGIALAVIVALSVVALTREPVSLDPNTPEGVVQQYLQAISDEDYVAAHGFLSSEIQADCSAADIATNNYYDTFNAVLGDVIEVGDRVTVEASIQSGSTALDPGSNGYYEQFVLIKENGEWVLSEDPWPYFTYGCRS
jgi:hypothetical protein